MPALSPEPWTISSVRVAKLPHAVVLARIFLMLYKSPCVCDSPEKCSLTFGGAQVSWGRERGQVSEGPCML